MTIGTSIYIKLFGSLVGKDELGNCYYTAKKEDSFGRKKRMVKYKGAADPTKVPPRWHAWLHYTSDTPLCDTKYDWEKPNPGNLTGTAGAYFPPGHVLKGSKRDLATGDYEAWVP